MSEPRLAGVLVGRFGRLVWITLAGYAILVITAFAALSEIGLRRSLDHTATVIQSLLGLYADPGGERTTVAPAMLADQLLGMGDRFLITRTVATDTGGAAIYFLSPTMPAKLVEPLSAGATPGEVQEQLRRTFAERGRWRYRILHRRAGDFDVYVARSRSTYLLALAAVAGTALFLLPAMALVARHNARRAVDGALDPFGRVVTETQAIGPADLSKRLSAPTGVAEVSELAAAVNRLIERVEQAHRALEAFTADAAHELRTPLTHLRAQAQWALDEHRTVVDMQEALTAIGREVDQTTKMAEDLLLIARGDNRQLSLERREFDLTPLVHEVQEITEAMASDKALTVRCAVEGPVHALGDRDSVRQILLNLASNAVRYTAAGKIEFTLTRQGDDRVGVGVQDTGCGIATEHLEHIFDRFYRVDRSRSRDHGGTGLGLTIAQLLATSQGGRITVESTPGVGSAFVLWLPAAS